MLSWNLVLTEVGGVGVGVRVRWGWGGWRLDWGGAVRGLAVGTGLWLVEAGLG